MVAADDAHDALARRLRLGGDDAQTLADEGVHKGRLANVGITNDVYEAGFHNG